jgi:hypothetical protein
MKKAVIILSIAAFLLIFLAVLLTVSYGRLTLHVAFACEQINIFDVMRLKAMKSTPVEAAGYLEYTEKYYPSGTKQIPGSRLDAIVETARSNATREIIGYLRLKTGKDFGEEPKKWIEQLKVVPTDTNVQ